MILWLFFLLFLLGWLLISQGCASKGFVAQRVRPLETQIADLSSQVEGLTAEDDHIRRELARLDQKGIVKKVITNHSIMFDFDRWHLTDQAKDTLDQVAQELVSKENLAVFVVGHTDNAGPEPYNLLLGQRRAQSVAAYLLTEPRISPYKIYVESLGEFIVKAPNETPEGRALNRRVEVIFVETTLR
jgi:outer membrane protein OmpA-like peptidoglycan-associated protein